MDRAAPPCSGHWVCMVHGGLMAQQLLALGASPPMNIYQPGAKELVGGPHSQAAGCPFLCQEALGGGSGQPGPVGTPWKTTHGPTVGQGPAMDSPALTLGTYTHTHMPAHEPTMKCVITLQTYTHKPLGLLAVNTRERAHRHANT